jgi:alanine dehydrogenase
VLGGGVVGANATKIAVGLGANVTVLDVNLKTLAYLDDIYTGRISTQYSDPISVERAVHESDLVIGAVLIAGARAPRLVTEAMVKDMTYRGTVPHAAVAEALGVPHTPFRA